MKQLHAQIILSSHFFDENKSLTSNMALSSKASNPLDHLYP